MTTSPHQPAQRPPHANRYNPITLEDVQRSDDSSLFEHFGELNDPVARCVAIPILGFILFVTLSMPLMAPLLILVLLGCLLVRLDNRPRQIAAVPLTLAAIKLAFQMASRLGDAAAFAQQQRGPSCDPGYVWLPVFFSACLIAIPRRDSLTFKMVLTGACLLLASGLLPGEGYLVVFYMINGLLFIGIVIGLIVDIKTHYQTQPQASLRPAS